MKLCWNDIENIRLSKFGNFVDIVKKKTFHLKVCKQCGEQFLGRTNAKFCCVGCSNIHNKTGINKSEESKQKIRDLWKDPKSLYNNVEYRKSLGSTKENNSNWKGGYDKKGIPTYDTYAYQLEWCEEVRRNKEDPNVLEVRCFKCGKWYVTKLYNVSNRIESLKDKQSGENHFYCSKECKNSCSIYGKKPETLMKEDAVRVGRLKWLELKREVQPELSNIVLERDEHKCVKCNDSNNLECHHIYPVNIEPLFSADVDNCITLCEECHKEVHKKDGCGYNQLKIKEC